MQYKYLISLILALLISELALADSSCERRYAKYNETTNESYLQLELECYPEGTVVGCGFELSLECQDKYEQLAITSSEEFNIIFADCPELFEGVEDGIAETNVNIQQTPTKLELLERIKKLKKKNKRLKNRISANCHLK